MESGYQTRQQLLSEPKIEQFGFSIFKLLHTLHLVQFKFL